MAKRLVLTVEADEDTLVRLATLICFAPAVEQPKVRMLPASPADLVDDGPSLTEDPEYQRQEIVRLMPLYARTHGVDALKRLFASFSATRVSELQPVHFPPLLHALRVPLPELPDNERNVKQ